MINLKMLSAALITTVSLAACTPAETATIKQIQDATVLACGFLPTAVTIANAVPGAQVYTVPASAIASAICAAVTAKLGVGPNRSTEPVTVKFVFEGKDVQVTGKFQ